MVYEEQKGLAVRSIRSTNGLSDVIGMLSGVFYRFRGVAAEAAATFRTDDSRESLRFRIRKRIHHDIFDPVGMATRTAAILVPTAGNGVEFQELVPDRIRHIVAPQVFREIICIL